jgi:hypothetical protein
MAQTLTVNSKGELAVYRLNKAPADVMVVKVDFALYFGSETASTLTVTPDSGLTVGTTSVASNVATVPVSGGSDGCRYDVSVKLAGSTQTKEVVFRVGVSDPATPNPNDYEFTP